MAVFKRGLTPLRIVFYKEGMDAADGVTPGYEYYGVCLFSEVCGEVYTDDGRNVETVAKVVIDGDAAPSMAVIGGGLVTVDTPDGERKFRIARFRRVRIEGRRVRHTVLELCR